MHACLEYKAGSKWQRGDCLNHSQLERMVQFLYVLRDGSRMDDNFWGTRETQQQYLA